ncbi:hypothetical protein [Natrialba asiatica]|uniref:TrbL/VirB6 plasmid conjugal transfer protein n=1 Tax=Natrialba asiatica (strain ATCC 700177 / DSM 12278 / JCM 9576 / FERM P-10747 / NBRC 102637 / 172P1) TaxID=29540 RepID=M0AG05_NATA1|nr:hypothetical protein [Natrialba asiatica]ELY97464.1 hypothetical protein C481_20481 [Natrialba asiatica DSM 12278]
MTIPRLPLPIKGIIESVDPTILGSAQKSLAILPGGNPAITVAFVSDWIADFFIYILTGILGFITTLVAGGMQSFIIFDSPYNDPAMQGAFEHNLAIFPQLLVIVFMAGIASAPFSDQREVTNFMLVWKTLKVIIFVAVGRQIMHFGLLLTNAIILHIYTDDYGDAFGPEVLEAGFEGAASLGAGAIIGGIIINLVSVAGILLALGVFVFREFLFHATFILLPVLGAMLYLDFGPLRHSSAIAKTLLRATAYMLLAGIVMAGLLQTGAAAVGAYSDIAVQGEEMTEAEFGELIEAMLFWLIGLLAPALVGLKAAAMAGMSPRGLGRRSAKSSSKSQAQSSSTNQSGGKSRRTALMEQARYGGARGAKWGDSLTGGRGSSAASRVGSRVGQTKAAVGSAASSKVPDGIVSRGKTAGSGVKKGGKRAVQDMKAGATYGPRNLHESPTEWAAAGLERYRENPVIDTSTQQSTSDGVAEASTNAADTSPDPESSQQTLDEYDNNNN